MLRIHRVQLFDNLSDPAMEDALYYIASIQRLVGLAAQAAWAWTGGPSIRAGRSTGRWPQRPGQRWRLDSGGEAARAERRKASIRAKVEHPFRYVKRQFGYAWVRYRGLAKNRTRLCLLFGLANR